MARVKTGRHVPRQAQEGAAAARASLAAPTRSAPAKAAVDKSMPVRLPRTHGNASARFARRRFRSTPRRGRRLTLRALSPASPRPGSRWTARFCQTSPYRNRQRLPRSSASQGRTAQGGVVFRSRESSRGAALAPRSNNNIRRDGHRHAAFWRTPPWAASPHLGEKKSARHLRRSPQNVRSRRPRREKRSPRSGRRTDESALEAVRIAALGKKGAISALLGRLRQTRARGAQGRGRPSMRSRTKVADALASRRRVLKDAALDTQLKREAVDVTLPVRLPGIEYRSDPSDQPGHGRDYRYFC